MIATGFTADELYRYSRHFVLPGFGADAQQRLKDARVLIVGAGGLGSPAALYLAAAGIGTLGLVDFDAVDVSNLQRQVIYGGDDAGRQKIEAAAARIHSLNPHVSVRRHDVALSADNAIDLVTAYDVVLDGTDNFPTRYLVNDACVLAGRPNVYGSVFRFEGQASVFAAPGGPCYRCLHPEPPPEGLIPNCSDAGVLGVLPGVIGTIQATEAIKLVTGTGEPLVGRLLLYDALRLKFRELTLPRDPDCPICGDRPVIRSLVAYERQCDPAGADVPIAADRAPHPMESEMTADELQRWRDDGTPHVLIDVREPSEHAASAIDGAILIPLRKLPFQLDQIPRDRPVVVHCKSGGRSAIAVAMLKLRGIDAHNLSGGILAWDRRERQGPS